MVEIKNIITAPCTQPHTWFPAYLPALAYVPLSDDGNATEPSVKVGAKVAEGQVIAYRKNHTSASHASLPGIVKSFQEITLHDGKRKLTALIEFEGAFTHLGKEKKKKKSDTLSAKKIICAITDKGILNTFKYPQPLDEQIQQKHDEPHDVLIVRLYDLDPSICTDLFIFQTFMFEVFEGATLVAAAIEASTIIFLHDTQNMLLKNLASDVQNLFTSFRTLFIPINTGRYPCGGPNEIVDLIQKSKKDVTVSVNDMMIDTVTLYSVYKAVYYNEPVMERFVYVCGDAIQRAKMFKTRIGTPISALIEECGGFSEKPGRIIVNGLICGNEIGELSVPVTKDLKSVYVMAKRRCQDRQPYDCVRCGRCRQVCPAKLHPDALYAQTGDFKNEAVRCYDCSLCNAACPSRLPLNQAIKQLAGKGGVL